VARRTGPNRSWPILVARAKALVEAFIGNFGRAPTLRRLHYELVSDAIARAWGYVNNRSDYSALSDLTAQARRDGLFPDLTEEGRTVYQHLYFEDADDVREYIRRVVRTDRMKGQEHSVCIVVEKAGSRPFLIDWFGQYGVLIAAVGGYDSQTQINWIRDWQEADGRPMDVIYAGDLDASGEDIDRDFRDRLLYEEPPDSDRFILHRVALLPSHIATYNLTPEISTKEDSRAAGFIARHGIQFQVELDAMDPAALRALYQAEFDKHWDYEIWEEQKKLEADLIKEVLGEV